MDDKNNNKFCFKTAFKKFLEPQKPAENENIESDNAVESISLEKCSLVDEEKSIPESSVISCSSANSDSGSRDCKIDNISEQNLSFSQANDDKSTFDCEFPPLNMNMSKNNKGKKVSQYELPSKKIPPRKRQIKIPEANSFKPRLSSNIHLKWEPEEIVVKPPIVAPGDIPPWEKYYNYIRSKTPQRDDNPFKSISSANSSVVEVPSQKDTPSKEYENIENFESRKEYGAIQKNRYEQPKKYKNYKESESMKKAKEIFERAGRFKPIEKFNINDFDGSGVDLFKKDGFDIYFPYEPKRNTCDDPSPDLPPTGRVASTLLERDTREAINERPVPIGEEVWELEDMVINYKMLLTRGK